MIVDLLRVLDGFMMSDGIFLGISGEVHGSEWVFFIGFHHEQ